MNNIRDYNETNSNKKNDLDDYRRIVEKIVNLKLIYRYEMPIFFHDVKIINDMIFNEKTHIVEMFKEFLIYDDNNEFFKRYYNKNEILIKLPKILNFYENYSKIYANYTAIPENKFMYKNIKRKQKVINQMQNNYYDYDYDEEENEEGEQLRSKIFTSKEIKYIDSFSISLNNNNSIVNNSKSDIEAKELINKINYYEKEAIYFKKNKIVKNINIFINKNSNKVINNANRKIEKIKEKHLLSEKNSSLSNLINSNVKIKFMGAKNKLNLINTIYNNKSNNLISINDISKSDKNILSTNHSNSPNFQTKKKITPSEGNTIIKKKNIFSNIIFNKKEKLIKKISKENTQSESQINNKYSPKLFSNSKVEKIKFNNNNNYNIITINKKSKSNSKGKIKEKLIYNYNSFNNIHEGSTPINIYSGNDFINTNLNSNNKFHKISPIYSNNNCLTLDNSINNSNMNNNRDIKKKISKLNLRKIVNKNVPEKQALSDRKFFTKNIFEYIGKKNHLYKNNVTDLKSNSSIKNNKYPSILNRNLNDKSKIFEYNHNDLNNIYFKRINSNSNIGNKIKLKNLGSLINKNSETNIIHDRFKKKILFK